MILKKILKCLSIMVLIGLISVFALGCSNEEAPGTSDQDNEEKPTYIVAFEATFPPFESKDEETGEFIGFDIDLIRAIGEVEGFDVELMEMGFDGIVAAVQTGNVDLGVSGLTIDEDRLESVDFSTPYYHSALGIDCHDHCGIHYWSDYFYFEIIDPDTAEVLPPGKEGELVISTLTKEGLPLLRYRTRDITRLLPEPCSCGSPYPMIDRILGRSDEAFKVKGVLVFPGQIDSVLKNTPGVSSEYQVVLTRQEGRDCILLRVEGEAGVDPEQTITACRRNIKRVIGILADIEVVPQGGLPRSEKKTKRVFDQRVK
jgi:hypothetical protein